MDIFQKLRDAEYALKDHVEAALREKIGPDWIARCGMGEDRLATWRKRKDALDPSGEGAREPLIAFGDLSDLSLILREHWSAVFSDVFGDLATMEAYLHVLERYRDRFLHVLVDEYQDTNLIQCRLTSMLASRHRNLCVVGDDDQS